MSPHVDGRDAAAFRLDEAVADVFGDLRLAPVLKRLLRHTRRLTGSVAGSVSLVDAEHGSYVKAAEYGDFCRLGDTFSLDEGATGRAFDRRRPVVIPDYGRMRTNHLHGPRHPGRKGPAAAVPIWWRGDVIAVNVAFTGDGGLFTAREVDDLEALTQAAASAIIQSGRHDLSPASEIRRRLTSKDTVVTEVGVVRPVSPELARVAADLVAAAARSRPDPRLHIAIVYRPSGLRVLVQDENIGSPGGPDPLGLGATSWDELIVLAGGGVTVEEVRGWGVLVRADLPYSIGVEGGRAETPYAISAEPAPFTPREAEVLDLLRQGLTDREIAGRLVLSAKTVEKHVGAIMRKTKTTNRTAAVMAALEHDW
jgi:DNA-binding CsgD family transcriptional regulator